jgi:signal transduction histidine kinase
MNFRDLRWIRRPPEIDLAATLSRTDPDGFSYEELWFVSMKRDVTEEDLARIATVAPEPLLIQMQRRARGAQGAQADSSTLGGVTLLLMSRDAQRRPQFRNEQMRTELFENRSSRNIRIRVWDEGQLAVLLRRYPSLAFKYFLDQEERPFDARHRKTSGDFYRENTLLNTRLQETLRKLEEETERRTRAEREAVWKDLSFQAAHRLGNPIFAIETDLQNLKGKLSAKASGTRSLVNEMKGSVEKAKAIIQQFKSLMAAQELTFGPVALPRIVEDACRVARDQGVAVTTQVAADIPQLSGDLSKLAGCFDELIANALHFLSEKDAQTIDVEILAVQKGQLPTELDGSKTYLLVRMADNGSGIPLERKHEIFRPFFTTYAQGAGLGLALVETVVVGHGGMVREVGEPEKGAVFEVFLPVGQ